MDLRKAFATNKRAETEGRKLYLDRKNDVWLLIARKGNANYKAYLTQVLQENQGMLNTKSAEAEELAKDLFRTAASKHLLIGWSPTGIDDGELKDIPYSQEAARRLLDIDDFSTMVDEYASNMANYRDEEVAKDAKN